MFGLQGKTSIHVTREHVIICGSDFVSHKYCGWIGLKSYVIPYFPIRNHDEIPWMNFHVWNKISTSILWRVFVSWNFFIHESSSIENSWMISHGCSSIKHGIPCAWLFAELFTLPSCQFHFARLQSQQCPVVKSMLPSQHSQAANSTLPMQHCQIAKSKFSMWTAWMSFTMPPPKK